MANKPNSKTAATPATPEPSIVKETVAAPITPPVESPIEKQSYYRVKKLSAFLYQILEVQVDEAITPPSLCGKADLQELVMGKLYDYAYPHPDSKRPKGKK